MNSKTVEIKQLENLLTNSLASNTILKKYVTNSLIEPGENYGSILISVTVEYQDILQNSTKKLHLVAKTCPKSEWLKTLFQTSITFKREIAMYDTIIPTLIEFQLKQGAENVISFFPKLYGARVSLNEESSEVDEDAMILMENLKFFGFGMIDRMEGFDLFTTKLILRNLAVLHAIPVAIKVINYEIFNYKILPHLHFLDNLGSCFRDVIDLFIDNVIEAANLTKECIPFIPQVLKAIKFSIERQSSSIVPQEPFATLIHNDLWVNNIMLKCLGEEVTETKFLDFQFIGYGSPGNDILFFLYTSVQFEIVNLHFDELIRYYYDVFIDTLKSLKCDTEPFSYELFLQEIEDAAKHQFWHILHMLQPVFTPKGTAIDINKIMEKNREHFKFLSEKYCKRVSEIILDFVKRSWI